MTTRLGRLAPSWPGASPAPARRRAVWASAAPVFLLPAAAIWFGHALAPWILMWVLALAVFAGCKWLTWRQSRSDAPPGRSVAYLVLWPGMDAAAFLDTRRRPARPSRRSWTSALAVTMAGAALVWVVARVVPPENALLRGWIGMVGLIFLCHFGIFRLLALGWQSAGVDAQPIMRAPFLARSLGEFWGSRWNRGFNDLVRRYVFVPASTRFGPAGAMLATFFASGLVHDLVLSVPAGGGHGLPTMYFVLQGLGLQLEHSRWGAALGLRHGIRGRLFAMGCVSLPAGLLFPPVFVERVMVPFLEALHAI